MSMMGLEEEGFFSGERILLVRNPLVLSELEIWKFLERLELKLREAKKGFLALVLIGDLKSLSLVIWSIWFANRR